jgi:hypothetical protein
MSADEHTIGEEHGAAPSDGRAVEAGRENVASEQVAQRGDPAGTTTKSGELTGLVRPSRGAVGSVMASRWRAVAGRHGLRCASALAAPGVNRSVEGGSFGGGRAAAARALLGQTRNFPCCPRMAGTTEGDASSCSCAGMLSTVGGVRGAACSLGEHLGPPSDVGRVPAAGMAMSGEVRA